MNELHTFKAGAALPAAQAFLSGVFFSLVVVGVCLLAGKEQTGVLVLVGGSSCAFVTWMVLLRHWVELVNHQAGFQPARVLEPEPLPSSVRIELVEQNSGAWRGDFIDLPATPEQLRLVACSAVSGGSLSENGWCGANRPFTKAQFHQLRDALLERGWLQWRSSHAPAQGVEVTHVGRRVFQYLAEGNHLLNRFED